MLKKIGITMIVVAVASFAIGCSSGKKAADKAKGINVVEVKKLLDVVAPEGKTLEESVAIKMADDYAGVGKEVDKSINKDVFFIYAGLENKYNLKVSKPTAIVTVYGNTNNYTVTKTKPFEGDVIFVAHKPQENQYNGAKMITAEEFRKNY